MKMSRSLMVHLFHEAAVLQCGIRARIAQTFFVALSLRERKADLSPGERKADLSPSERMADVSFSERKADLSRSERATFESCLAYAWASAPPRDRSSQARA